MKHLLGTALFSLCLASTGHATQADSYLDSFAKGMELTTTSAGIQTLLLPESVYRGISSPILGDLRVFNAAGEPVPHALRTWVDEHSVEYGTKTRPLFAIQRASVQGLQLDDLTLTMTHTDEGSVLDLSTNAAAAGETDSPTGVAAHIVDLTGLERPVTALNFVLPGSTESFLCPFSIESSTDLSTWSTLVARETLASTSSGGSRLLRTRAELPQTTATYLRIQWLAEAPPLELGEVKLELAAGLGIPQRRSVRLLGSLRANETHTYDFPSAGPLPVTRIQVHLPEANTLVTASIVARQTEEGTSRTVLPRQQFFRTGNEGEFQNSPLSIRTNTGPLWSIFVDPNSSGLGQGAPELELEYSPHQLAFLAKDGEGPFTLAFGKYGERSPYMAWSAMTKAQPGELSTETVTPGAIRDLAGPAALLAPEGEGQLKLYILWGVLIAGVGLLAGLSIKLARKMA
ncbi:MAG: hypothetical protein ACI9D0_002027 [Bacteroidia bacterium]|jgi:hypothetical protein